MVYILYSVLYVILFVCVSSLSCMCGYMCLRVDLICQISGDVDYCLYRASLIGNSCHLQLMVILAVVCVYIYIVTNVYAISCCCVSPYGI